MSPEALAIALFVQISAQGLLAGVAVQQRRCLPVEAQNIAQQRPVTGIQQIAPPPEKAAQAVAAVFHAGFRVGDREAHGGGLTADAELRQQRLEARIGAVVEHDKAHVHGVVAVLALHVHGEGVATQPGLGFEQRHLVVAAQIPGGGEAGDAAADNGDTLAQEAPPFCWFQASRAARKALSTRCLTPWWATIVVG